MLKRILKIEYYGCEIFNKLIVFKFFFFFLDSDKDLFDI